MEELFFPYKEFRKGQMEFISEVDLAIKERKHLIVHAPTGMGKTISTIAPSLAYALKKEFTVFFLTNRHSQHKIVLETLRKIKQKYDINFLVADVIGKKHMCSFDDVEKLSSREFYDYCKELREKELCPFYTNSKSKEMKVERELIYEKIKKEGPLTVEQVFNLVNKKFCTFEITADICRKANIIIADYFHILSPGIRDSFLLRINKEIGKSIIILDEAHNLAKRLRELMSETLSTFTIENAIKEAREFEYINISEVLKELKLILDDLKYEKLEKTEESLIKKEEFYERVNAYTDYFQFIGDLYFLADLVREKKKRSYSSGVANFLKAWSINDEEGFTRILQLKKSKIGKEIITLNLKCLDPSILFKPLINNSLSLICMSGTLLPTEMYQDLLGFDEAICKEYKNPFPYENRLNLIVSGVTTKFTKRSNEMYGLIATKASNILEKIPGNILMFFPSYEVMYNISANLRNLTKRKLLLENPANNKEERNELLEEFKTTKNSILLAVAAGSYGEGIDLPGIIKGVIIVGLPLNKPDLETMQLIDYYDKKYAKGWEYAYIFPAIIKTLQNAGRCIRSEKDKGVIVFLEERYKWSTYRKCFPDDLNLVITNSPEVEIEKFFEK
ncbi:ATP-dependent DNA helicase [Candidatus Woesearchaeota archaeon]|nr:ATP-dependent DNA helicase [Candidatus Woesearchaeota archaeon]